MPKDIVKWEPFREVSRLRREMDRLWELLRARAPDLAAMERRVDAGGGRG